MKDYFLFFDTNFIAELRKAKIKNGKVVLDDGEHIIDKTTPFQLRTMFGIRPLYIMKWNSMYPATFKVKEVDQLYRNVVTNEEMKMKVGELVPVDITFYEKGGLGYSPEVLKDTHDQRFLKGMKKYAEGGGRDWKNIMSWVLGVMIFLAGTALIYMFMTGQIKF